MRAALLFWIVIGDGSAAFAQGTPAKEDAVKPLAPAHENATPQQTRPDIASRGTSIQAAMTASIEAQLASARRQATKAVQGRISGAASSPPPPPAFFTIPWPELAPLASSPTCEPLPQSEIAGLIEESAKRENVQPELLRAVLDQESGGRPCAVSIKGAQGLMQLMPATQEQLQVADAFDPRENVLAGAKLLKQLLTRYGNDVALALGAYNAGPGRVDKEGTVPQNAETQAYVSDILNRMRGPAK